MSEPVHIAGAGRTDFKRNIKKEGKTIRDLILEAGRAAIEDSGIDPSDFGSGVVGCFASGLFARQLQLGAYLTEIDLVMKGIPTLHAEAACASGSVALLSGIHQIMAGQTEVVLVVGVEQQKTMSPADGSDVLGAAGDYAIEKARFGDFMFPKLFAEIARLYTERFGLTEQQLARVAVKNQAHARFNPLAQKRDSALTMAMAAAESDLNRRIAPLLKSTDCSQITDGAAAVVLCSGRFAGRLKRRPPVRLIGYGHTTDHLALDRKDAPVFSVARSAAEQAYEQAGIRPCDLHGAEVHDCFSISEIVAYEVLGFAGPGQGPALLDSGATALPSIRGELSLPHPSKSQGGFLNLPVNPGGGLIGDGHPVGATGVRQVVEAYLQLTGNAGERTIPGAKTYLTFNMGGTLTTNVVMIWTNS